MRSGLHGTFATLLLMIPLLSIPALAIFGIPQFAPVVASPLDESPNRDRERRVGHSDRNFDDSFSEDLEDAPPFADRDSESNGQIGDAVPLNGPRPGRPRSSRLENDRSRGNRRSFQDSDDAFQDQEASTLDSRQALAQADSRSAPIRPFDRTSLDVRLDSRSKNGDFGQARIQPASMPGNGAGARVFQRQRDPKPEAAISVQPAVLEADALTWQAAVKKLNDLEIRNFRLQPGHREHDFVFICSYTPSDSPRVSYRFEAEADEPLKAVDKVLEQIAEWQQRR
jgi:hypothetical protein